MARELIANVNVDGTWYGPDHQPFGQPDAEIAERISNPKVWSGESGSPKTSVDAKEPPRKGPGSGQDAWTTFARSKGVTETFDSKDALISELETRGLIAKV